MATWMLVINGIALFVLAVVIYRLIRVERRMKLLGAPAKPFWANLQTKLAADLTHPSPQFQEMDELIRDLEALTITPERRDRLKVLLIERTTSDDPEVDDSERSSAKIMLEAMDKVLDEAASTEPLVDIESVGVKKKSETPKDEEHL